MQIYIKEITLRTTGDTKVYDGTALTCNEYQIDGSLLYGHSVKYAVCSGSQITVGKSANTCSISIVDSEGMDVTSQYKINRAYGTLTVTSKIITVTANSATEPYTGSALTDSGYTIDGDVEGYTVIVKVSGSQTAIGYSDNVVESVIIKDSTGKDVTLNFSVICVNGKLYVTPNNN